MVQKWVWQVASLVKTLCEYALCPTLHVQCCYGESKLDKDAHNFIMYIVILVIFSKQTKQQIGTIQKPQITLLAS